jgi:RimJ/RimL family protein N-acetyltransferase
MEFDVQPSPAGGWRVMLRGHPAPVSSHDTEEEALQAAASYARGSSAPTGEGELVDLRDGPRVRVRPVVAGDRDRLAAGFERLGEWSRYQRFLGYKKRLTDSELAFLTQPDHHDHEALAALDPDSGDGVGVARFVRDPYDPAAAEAAVAVVDAWQGRGVGGALLGRLATRAREEGIERFKASLLVENRAMLALFERLGSLHLRRDAATAEIEVQLPVAAGGSPQLARALRAAAAREVGAPQSADPRRLSTR